jgi:tRNA (cytidine/uridine-2'-O-)-methyltransferase
MFDIILLEPEIPPNTGNIVRLCANTGCRLHLVHPLGFSLADSRLRRAGLDYRDLVRVHEHRDLPACLGALAPPRLFALETGGARRYSEAAFAPGDAFLFGSETAGLPRPVLESLPRESLLSIPMRPANRSMNLSNAVALVVYEAWRQQGFAGA